MLAGDEALSLSGIDSLKAQASENNFDDDDTNDVDFDAEIAPVAMAVHEDRLVVRGDEENAIPWGQVEEVYGEEYHDLYHVLDEYHHLLFDTYGEEMENAVGYLSISMKQEGLVRIHLLMTWDGLDDRGRFGRQLSGKAVYVHAESEWHEH